MRLAAIPVLVALDGLVGDGEPGENDLVGADVEIAVGGLGDDSLVGNTEQNALFGLSGADQLSGGSEEDLLDAGDGADRSRVGTCTRIRSSAGSASTMWSQTTWTKSTGCENVHLGGPPPPPHHHTYHRLHLHLHLHLYPRLRLRLRLHASAFASGEQVPSPQGHWV